MESRRLEAEKTDYVLMETAGRLLPFFNFYIDRWSTTHELKNQGFTLIPSKEDKQTPEIADISLCSEIVEALEEEGSLKTEMRSKFYQMEIE